MIRRILLIGTGAILLLAITLVGCRNVAPPVSQTVTVSSSWPALTVPEDVQKIAVFYPRSSIQDYSEAYHRLEGAVFQLKAYRSTLTLVDRFNVPTVLTELRFQNSGAVTEDSAMRVESAEVVYLDVVIAKMQDYGYGDRWMFDNLDYDQLSREALERSIKQTVVDLQRAFQ